MPWQRETTQEFNAENFEWPWKGLFGRSSTSELLSVPVPATDISKVIFCILSSTYTAVLLQRVGYGMVWYGMVWYDY